MPHHRGIDVGLERTAAKGLATVVVNVKNRKFLWMVGESTGHGYVWYELEHQPDFQTSIEAGAWMNDAKTRPFYGFNETFKGDGFMLVRDPTLFNANGIQEVKE
jgi:hypothetical protein